MNERRASYRSRSFAFRASVNTRHVPMVLFALKMVIPLARRWIDAQQTRILTQGVPLTLRQAADAALAGVREPERVRLLRVKVIPTPLDSILCGTNGIARRISRDTIGMTFGHGIIVRDDFWTDRSLLVHELVHVGQYERFGSSRAFLQAYLAECLVLGYGKGPLEQEAVRRAAAICGNAPGY